MKTKLYILLVVAVIAAAFTAGVATAQRSYGTPSSLVHVVSIQWKADASEADRQKALDGVKEMAAKIPGIKNVWIKATRVQPREFHAAFAIEFENREAADAYADHPAHREWESYYLPVREQSRSLQITN
ncbi:MAG: Dabb family protein [Acidobacteria bacterium]|nr:Dabb family protein [Acidobacteriota bacterium]